MSAQASLWLWRLLALLPAAVGVLWAAGVAHFRQYALSQQEWLVIVAFACSAHVLVQRMVQPMPMPKLQPGVNPANVALLAAAIFGALAGIAGGLFDFGVETWVPSAHPLPLRALWHAACVFAASYAFLLRRLYSPQPRGAARR